MLRILISERYCIIVLTILCTLCAGAQSLPSYEGERARYGVQIDVGRAYISGICGMLFEDGRLKASVVSEFGFPAMDFEYNPQRDRVKIISVVKKLDHWYIRRVLRRDLRVLIHNLRLGVFSHENAKYGITYTFTPMEMKKDETTE